MKFKRYSQFLSSVTDEDIIAGNNERARKKHEEWQKRHPDANPEDDSEYNSYNVETPDLTKSEDRTKNLTSADTYYGGKGVPSGYEVRYAFAKAQGLNDHFAKMYALYRGGILADRVQGYTSSQYQHAKTIDNNYLQELIAQQNDREYNSEESQNERLNATGINPNLGDSASALSDATSDTSSGISSSLGANGSASGAVLSQTQTMLSNIAQTIQICTGLATTGVNLASGFGALEAQGIANDQSALRLLKDTIGLFDDTGVDLILDKAIESIPVDEVKGYTDMSSLTGIIEPAVISAVQESNPDLLRSRRGRSAVKKYAQYLTSTKSQYIREKWKNTHRSELLESSKFGDVPPANGEYGPVLNELGGLQAVIYKNQLKVQSAQSEYEATLAGEVDNKKRAEAHAKYINAQTAAQNEANTLLSTCVDRLSSMGRFGQVALSLLFSRDANSVDKMFPLAQAKDDILGNGLRNLASAIIGFLK